jgi:predicted nucleic acid-binding protein
VAIKWLFREEDHVEASFALLVRELQTGDAIPAPPLLASDVTNIIHQRMRRDEVTLNLGWSLLDEFAAVPIRVIAPSDLYHQALSLAHKCGLSAANDAQVVALAQITNRDLWTTDQRLIRRLHGELPIRWIGDYAG